MESKIEIKETMKILGKLSLKTLPDLLVYIPVIGIPLSNGTKLFIGGLEEIQSVKNDKKIDDQFEKIMECIKENLTTEEIFIDTVKKEMMKLSLIDYPKKQIYMFGVSFFTLNEEIIRREEQEQIKELFLDNDEQEDKICDFIDYYLCGSDLISEGVSFYFYDDKLVINFDEGGDNYIYDEDDVRDFADAINRYIGYKLFFRYVIY